MYDKMYSPNVLAVASSLVGEDSLSVSFLDLCSTAVVHLFPLQALEDVYKVVVSSPFIFFIIPFSSTMWIQQLGFTSLIGIHTMPWISWKGLSQTAPRH